MTGTIDSWDSGGSWDDGLQWDVNTGPNPGVVTGYLNLVTNEHQDKPKFMATLAATLQPFADLNAVLDNFSALFDVDCAVGAQLDVVGQWVGRSRYLSVPLTGVYFSFDTVGVGFDQGVWQGPYDPTTGLTTLPDEPYRTLLKATIAANHWDGTVPGAYTVWNTLFMGTGYGILIIDHQDMSMDVALTGNMPDAVTLSLFTGGYLSLRPAGVRINNFITPSVSGVPYFGFDIENSNISGFDVGAFGLLTPGP